eukprot:9624618-Karenia_brevis.AAC.1
MGQGQRPNGCNPNQSHGMGWEMQWYQGKLRLEGQAGDILAAKPPVWGGALQGYVRGGQGEIPMGKGSTA